MKNTASDKKFVYINVFKTKRTITKIKGYSPFVLRKMTTFMLKIAQTTLWLLSWCHLRSSPLSFGKKKSSPFQNCFMAPRTGLEPWTHCIPHMRYIGLRGDATSLRLKAERYSQSHPERQIRSQLLVRLALSMVRSANKKCV